jgi:alpha-L-fucosidase
MLFEPTNTSLSTRPRPSWYDNAKLGIFIHWGLYSVPAFAQGTNIPLEEALVQDGGRTWFANNPYAEWYYNSLKIEGSSTQAHHIQTYGEDFSYWDFLPLFNEAIEQWNPDEMADLFAQTGARYVVLTTKHHEGFLLWHSQTPNPFLDHYYARRDLVGELTKAVRDRALRMGVYYSSAAWRK